MTTSTPGGWGGGYFHICMHIGYVPCERTPFSALNFRSGAYIIFTNDRKICSGASQFYIFCHSEDHHFQTVFNFNPFIAAHGRLTTASQQRPGVSGRPECQPDASYSQFQSRSGAPHFSLCRGTYLPKYGVSTPPPPPWCQGAKAALHMYFEDTGGGGGWTHACDKHACMLHKLACKLLNLNFHQFCQKCSILTPDIRRQPRASLESRLKGRLTVSGGAMYINLWYN